jgi:hypothetical protein
MPEDLIQAIRARNLDQATQIVHRLQHHMSRDKLITLVIACVERLAWDEGDHCAAIWLIRTCHSRR